MFKPVMAAAIALTATTALAAPRNVTMSADGAITHFTGTVALAPAHFRAPGKHGAVIFSTLDTAYNCCSGWTVSAKGSSLGLQFWEANSFTPTANATAKEIDLALSNSSGTNAAEIALYADNKGVPGKLLWSALVKNFPPFGSSTTQVAVGKIKTGIALTAGTTYWVAALTNKKTSDSFDVWNFTGDGASAPLAQNRGSGWTNSGSNTAAAFAVYD